MGPLPLKSSIKKVKPQKYTPLYVNLIFSFLSMSNADLRMDRNPETIRNSKNRSSSFFMQF